MELITSDLADDFSTINHRYIQRSHMQSSYPCIGLPSISLSEIELGMGISRASSFYGEPQSRFAAGMDICMYYYEKACFYTSFLALFGLFAFVIYLLVYAHQHNYN